MGLFITFLYFQQNWKIKSIQKLFLQFWQLFMMDEKLQKWRQVFEKLLDFCV